MLGYHKASSHFSGPVHEGRIFDAGRIVCLGRNSSPLRTSPHKSLAFRVNVSSTCVVIIRIERVCCSRGKESQCTSPNAVLLWQSLRLYPLEHRRRAHPSECIDSRLFYITMQSLSFFSPSSNETAELGPPLLLRIGPGSPLPRPLAEPLAL